MSKEGDVIVVDGPPTVEVISDVGTTPKNNGNRIGKCGRKRKEDGALPSNKLQKPTRGAGSFLDYQAFVKAESTAASIRVRDEKKSYLRAGKSMQAALMEHGVSLHESTCCEHVKKAVENGCVGLEPQCNGGQALPSSIEKKIAEMVKHLREQKYPVFPDDVMTWAAEAIEETFYASYFPDGMPTRG